MTPTDLAAVKAQIKSHEGVRLRAYRDTRGVWTIGIGRNLSDKGISPEEAELLFEHDLVDAVTGCEKKFPWFARLDGVRQRVIVDMAFNLGIAGLSTFSQMFEFMRMGRYELAADAMLESRWATQVGLRATRLAQMMRTGSVV